MVDGRVAGRGWNVVAWGKTIVGTCHRMSAAKIDAEMFRKSGFSQGPWQEI